MSNDYGTKIELSARPDKFGNTYHVGKNKSPCALKFKKGVAFFVYLSEEDAEEIHVACARPGSDCDSVKRRLNEDGSVDKLIIKLKRLVDKIDQDYFLAIVQDDSLELDFSEGYVFMVFTSKPGDEELHIFKDRDVNRDRGDFTRRDSETQFRAIYPRKVEAAF